MSVSKVNVPRLLLNNGRKIPSLALGTCLGFDENGIVTSKNKELRNVIEKAIDMGYRHFDTASMYATEDEVGEGVTRKIEDGSITREDVFVTTKLWNTDHKPDQVLPALKESLKKLGLDYVDLYLMHWPIGVNADYSHNQVDYLDTWRAMEELVKAGLTKSIGVSNFNATQIQRLLDEAEIKPAALEIELHPNLVQKDLVKFAKKNDVVVMAYMPFGPLVPRFGQELPSPRIDDPALVEMGKKYGKTTPQVVLRWLVERGAIPIPKTVNPKRLEENLGIFDFALDQDEIDRIDAFDIHRRYTLPSFWQTHPYYPFEQVDNPIDDPFAKKDLE